MSLINPQAGKSLFPDAEPTLVFIPDISGFTRFVSETEVDHSRHIIGELLEIIIDSNELDLVVSEVEGDAVLFYKQGSLPSLSQIQQQSEQMFRRFHRHLLHYEFDRLCNCGACSSASGLSLKMVASYGDVSAMQIRNHSQLHGEAVILGHRLLKNNVPGHEYLLLTKTLHQASSSAEQPNTDPWITTTFEEPDLGPVDIVYMTLSPLLEKVRLEVQERPVPDSTNPVKITLAVAATVQEVYDVLIDLDQKMNWTPGLEKVEYDTSKVPRVGSSHMCYLPAGVVNIQAIAKEQKDGQMKYVERTENFPVLGEVYSVFTLIPNKNHTNLQLELYPSSTTFSTRLKLFFLRSYISRTMTGILKRFAQYVENKT